MDKIKQKIVVLSGKGGVGKSTVTANLAIALASRGHAGRVGVLDADITGPSIPMMLGVRSHGLAMGPPGVFPALDPFDMKVMSMDYFLASDETPVIWRGPLKSAAIRQFLGEVVWGDLDFLIVDLPPGTGDEALTVMQSIPSAINKKPRWPNHPKNCLPPQQKRWRFGNPPLVLAHAQRPDIDSLEPSATKESRGRRMLQPAGFGRLRKE